MSGDFCPGGKLRFDIPAAVLQQDFDDFTGESLFPSDCPSSEYRCDTMMFSEIVLLFWPPKDKSPNICTGNGTGPITSIYSSSQTRYVVTMTDITFQGQNLFERGNIESGTTKIDEGEWMTSSVLRGTFTFTSPTVYIAHHPISARFEHGPRVPFLRTLLKPAGILTIDPADVSSIRPLPPKNAAVPSDYAVLVASGLYKPDLDYDSLGINRETVPFDFRNLLNPVPASAYYDARTDDCWGKQTHCGTITDDTYRPNIWINSDILREYMPEREKANFTCHLRRLDDPPISLQAIDNIDLPTLRPFSNIAKPTPSVEQVQPHLAIQPGDRVGSDFPLRTSMPYGLHTTAPLHMDPQREHGLSDASGRNRAGKSRGSRGGLEEGATGGREGGGDGGGSGSSPGRESGEGGDGGRQPIPGRESGDGGDGGRKSEEYVSLNTGGKWKQINPIISKGGGKGLGEIGSSKSSNKAGKFTKAESGFQDRDDPTKGEVGKPANTNKSSTAAGLWIPSRALLCGGYALMAASNILRALLV
jgi:hypothetical protein